MPPHEDAQRTVYIVCLSAFCRDMLTANDTLLDEEARVVQPKLRSINTCRTFADVVSIGSNALTGFCSDMFFGQLDMVLTRVELNDRDCWRSAGATTGTAGQIEKLSLPTTEGDGAGRVDFASVQRRLLADAIL